MVPARPATFFQKPTLIEERKPFFMGRTGYSQARIASGLGHLYAALPGEDPATTFLRENHPEAYAATRPGAPRTDNTMRDVDVGTKIFQTISSGFIDFFGTFTGSKAQQQAQQQAAQVAQSQVQAQALAQQARSESWTKVGPWVAIGGAALGVAIIWAVVKTKK